MPSSEIVFRVSLPPQRIHPNARLSMSKGAMHARRDAVKRYRSLVCGVAMDVQGARRPLLWTQARARLVFCYRRKARRDKDNLLAWFKAGFDGIRDAGLITDDSGLVHDPVEIETGHPSDFVTVYIRPL